MTTQRPKSQVEKQNHIKEYKFLIKEYTMKCPYMQPTVCVLNQALIETKTKTVLN